MLSEISKLLEENLSFWQSLNEEEQALVLNNYRILEYDAGQFVRGENADCLGLLMVIEGSLRASLISLEGRAITLYRIKSGETCVLAVSCVLDAISFDTQIEAEENTRVLLIPVETYSQLLNKNTAVECSSYKTAMERFTQVVSGLERLVFYNLEQRLTSFLLDESADTNSDTINMTHEQIATHIGSAREVVSRSLKSLSKQGLLEVFRGGVRLLDKPSLYQILG